MTILKAIAIVCFITRRSRDTMKIYLAGDSIVQDYRKEEFIAGWGQYLPCFFKDTPVINFAKGGRSTRLFINEGRFQRLFDVVEAGDYVLIEFCHNDDATKEYKTMFNRLTPLGPPDENGRYPVIPGVLSPKNELPQAYVDALMADPHIKDPKAVLKSVYDMLAAYPGDAYYPYSTDGSCGTYKWFLKQFADAARAAGANPVFVTAPARTVFDSNGHIKDGPGLHGGHRFAYIRAMKQLAAETEIPVLDLFTFSCRLFERIGPQKVHFLTSVKLGQNEGLWPEDFIAALEDPATVSEDTHFNKYGAYLMARALAGLIRDGIIEGGSAPDCRLAALSEALISDFDQVCERPPGKEVFNIASHSF